MIRISAQNWIQNSYIILKIVLWLTNWNVFLELLGAHLIWVRHGGCVASACNAKVPVLYTKAPFAHLLKRIPPILKTRRSLHCFFVCKRLERHQMSATTNTLECARGIFLIVRALSPWPFTRQKPLSLSYARVSFLRLCEREKTLGDGRAEPIPLLCVYMRRRQKAGSAASEVPAFCSHQRLFYRLFGRCGVINSFRSTATCKLKTPIGPGSHEHKAIFKWQQGNASH